jgi:hypothetical protein
MLHQVCFIFFRLTCHSVSLCTPQLITHALKLITMQASSDFDVYETRTGDLWGGNTGPNQLSYTP